MSVFNWSPTVRRNGHGNRPGSRNLQDYQKALKGHADSAHKGAVLSTCQGCKTLLQRIEEAQ